MPDHTTRTLVRVLIETGLRAIDARTLPLDALSHDAAGAPYLRYPNHKLARERYLPITPTLAEAIRDQQASVRRRFPDGPLSVAAWAKQNLARAKQTLRTATAACRCSSPARTPTPASPATTSSPPRSSCRRTATSSSAPSDCWPTPNATATSGWSR